MKVVSSLVLAAALFCAAAPASFAAPRQVLQGTQIRLQLLTSINSASAKDGDPFLAVVTEPVSLGSDLLLPAGARVRGIVTTVNRARRFAMFRGQAYINLNFRSVEVDSRLIPVQMSIIAIDQPRSEANGKQRKDVKVVEGQVVEQKQDIKGDIVAGAVGTGGGTLVGAVFSHALRGFGIGLAGSAAYIVARKGKEVNLPANTGLLVRLDNTITVPAVTASNTGYSESR
jgi:hypothetical protein